MISMLVATGCAGAQPQATTSSPSGGGASTSSAPSGPPKRIVAAVFDDVPFVYQMLNPASRYRGVETIQDLVTSGLTQQQQGGADMALLAEAVPTIENGLWTVLPNGEMETTWHIRPNAVWHDGVPFTSDDLLFTLEVSRDKDLPIFLTDSFDYISDAKAPDARTIVVHWNQPYIHANQLFSSSQSQFAMPIPKHIMEQAYRTQKSTFLEQSFWGRDWVGTGPFKIKEWSLGSQLVVTAFDQYVLGRPKLDEIEVRYFSDDQTLLANVLAGTIDVVIGRGITGPAAAQTVASWGGAGHLDPRFRSWISLYIQFIDPNPSILANVQFRRAAAYALNRKEMIDELIAGQSPVADSWLLPGQPQYQQIEAQNVTRYPYDPRQTAQLIEQLGYTKGADGMYVDGSGQKLNLEVRTTAGDDIREKLQLAIQDSWKRAGIDTTLVLIPRQQAQDLAYRATYPAFELNRNPVDEEGLKNWSSKRTPLPENNYQVAGNRSRYRSPELDTLVDRYFTTISEPDRMQVMGQVVRTLSEQVPAIGILYDAEPTLISNKLVNVGAGAGARTQAWNAYAWDVK
jgi:peptide/nickel transport system substrate-binding protein